MVLDNPLRALVRPALPEPHRGVVEVPGRPELGFERDDAVGERFRRSKPPA